MRRKQTEATPAAVFTADAAIARAAAAKTGAAAVNISVDAASPIVTLC